MIRSPHVRKAAWALQQVWSLPSPSSLCISGSPSSLWNTSPGWKDRSSDQTLNTLAFRSFSCWIVGTGAVYPLSWTVGLKLALVLLAAFGFVPVVIQALPQLVPGVPARLPLCGVWRWHLGHRRPRSWAGLHKQERSLSLQVEAKITCSKEERKGKYSYPDYVTVSVSLLSPSWDTHLERM